MSYSHNMQENASHVVVMASMRVTMDMGMVVEIWNPISFVMCMKVVVVSEKIVRR